MLLAIDTSTSQVGLALYDGIQVRGEMLWRCQAHHTQELAPALDDLLRRTGIRIQSLQALGVALGPGSFTSLRVGLAFAKGLALARALPLVGVPSLDVTARAVPVCDPQAVPGTRRRLAVVLQAGRGRLALAWYRSDPSGWRAEGPPQVTTAEELAGRIRGRTLICGELEEADRNRLARRFRNAILASPAECVRRPAFLAEIAWERFQAGQVDKPEALAPIYLHVAGGLPG